MKKRVRIVAVLGTDAGSKGQLPGKGQRELWGNIRKFYIMIGILITQVYLFVRIVQLKFIILMHVKSILKKKRKSRA